MHDVSPTDVFRPEVARGLKVDGYYVNRDEKPVPQEWTDKWYMFEIRERQKELLKDDEWYLLQFTGWTRDPEGKNLPGGPWEFSQFFEVDNFSGYKRWSLEAVRKGVEEKGFHLDWLEIPNPLKGNNLEDIVTVRTVDTKIRQEYSMPEETRQASGTQGLIESIYERFKK